MATYAKIDGAGQVAFVYTLDANGVPLPGSVDITTVNPQPGPGWTTPDNGVTWVGPALGNLLAAQASGLATVRQLAATIAAQLAQARADQQVMASWTAATGLTPDVVAVLQRTQAGFIPLLEGLGALVNVLYGPLGITTPVSAS